MSYALLSHKFLNYCGYGEITEWSNKPTVKVAVTVDAAAAVLELVMDRQAYELLAQQFHYEQFTVRFVATSSC